MSVFGGSVQSQVAIPVFFYIQKHIFGVLKVIATSR